MRLIAMWEFDGECTPEILAEVVYNIQEFIGAHDNTGRELVPENIGVGEVQEIDPFLESINRGHV